MNDDLDRLLETELVRVPAGFSRRMLAAIEALPAPFSASRPSRRRDLLEWLALAAAVIAGIPQLASFLFGVWIVTGAG